jgi:single-strand DNA-binding protein
MSGLNCVLLLGHLTRDPELRATPGGTPVAQFGLGVTRAWRTAAGDLQEETCFVEVVVWGRQAEAVAAHLTKGRAVFVAGRLQLDRWTADGGERRSRLKVVAARVPFVGRGPGGPGPAAPGDPVPDWVTEEAA